MSGLLYAFTIIAGSFVAATPLCYNTIVVAGGNDTAAAARGNDTTAATRGSSTTATAKGSLSDNSKLLSILTSAVKGFQLALFLKNLEMLFFQTGLTNIIE
jgi:sugar (pentulose or hexulose) kinase